MLRTITNTFVSCFNMLLNERDYSFLYFSVIRYSNITTVEHQRMRRSLKDVLGRIWKGFEFKLATPSMDWQKQIGGSSLGASFGLIIKNELDLKICKLHCALSQYYKIQRGLSVFSICYVLYLVYIPENKDRGLCSITYNT